MNSPLPTDSSSALSNPASVASDDPDVALYRRVLVVEDVLPERVRLAAMLKKRGYSVTEAANGAEALTVMREQPFGLVISDWRMPFMDGLTLLEQVKLRFVPPPYFILLTGQDAVYDLVAAMDAGADDFIRKPFNAEELRARVQAGARIVRLRNQLQGQNEQLFLALQREFRLNKTLQEDLTAAAQLQRTMLPIDNLDIPGLSIAHYFHPATGVAGDTYNILSLSERQIAFYNIDVVGHGVRSALLSFTLSRFLGDPTSRAIELTQTSSESLIHACSPAQIVAELNRRFLDDDHCRNYFTMVYGTLDLDTGRGRLCQAGHPHPLLIRCGGEVTPLGHGGVPVGVLETAEYEDVPFQLGEGDKLMIYSDGLLGCRLSDGRELDPAGLGLMLAEQAHLPAKIQQRNLQTLITDPQETSPAEDDISFMILERASTTHRLPTAHWQN